MSIHSRRLLIRDRFVRPALGRLDGWVAHKIGFVDAPRPAFRRALRFKRVEHRPIPEFARNAHRLLRSWPGLTRPPTSCCTRSPVFAIPARGSWNNPLHHHSTTFGTRKKLSSLAGAFLTMSSAMPPSVTTSARFFIVIGVTDVIGSTP